MWAANGKDEGLPNNSEAHIPSPHVPDVGLGVELKDSIFARMGFGLAFLILPFYVSITSFWNGIVCSTLIYLASI
jgi:hypothetical protein